MSHLRSYRIFPDKWAKTWTTNELNNARLSLKAYITNKETELGIREVRKVSFLIWCNFKGRMPVESFDLLKFGDKNLSKIGPEADASRPEVPR